MDEIRMDSSETGEGPSEAIEKDSSSNPVGRDGEDAASAKTPLRTSRDDSSLFDSSIVSVDDHTIEKLTYGVLAHFLPDLQKVQSTLTSLTENQRVLIESVQQENAKFAECQAMTDVMVTMEKAKQYHAKLVSIKKEMHHLHDKSAKLKKRAVRLQQQKQKEALQLEVQRERELERERQLIAKPVRKS